MKLHFHVAHKTPLQIAIEKGNSEIIQILLRSPNVNVNLASIRKNTFHL